MVQFRPQAREIIAKVVYYGPPLGGKTTNLRTLYDGYPPDVRGELLVVPAGGDRTIFFDFLPVDAGTLRGMRMRVQLYTVPGQVHYNATRQVVLRGVDAIVFVADSQRELLRSNRESWENLKENLALQGLNLADLPHVLQYNKRDLQDLLSVDDLDELLNEFNAPFFEAVASTGIGVEETLQGVVKLVARSLRDRFRVPAEEAPTVTEPVAPAVPAQFPGVVQAPPPRPRYHPPVPTFGFSSKDLSLGEPGPSVDPVRAASSEEPAGAQIFPFAAPPVAPPEPPAPPSPHGAPEPDTFAPAPELLPSPPQPFPQYPGAGDIFGEGTPVPAVTGKIAIGAPAAPPSQAPLALEDPFGTAFEARADAGADADVFGTLPLPAAAPPAAEPLPEFPAETSFESGPGAVAGPEPLGSVAPEPAGLVEPEPVKFSEPQTGVEEPEPHGVAAPAPAAEPRIVPELSPAVTASLSDEAGHAIVQRVVPRALAQVGEVRELELEVPVPAVWTGGKRITLQFRLTLIPEEESHAE